VIIQAFELNKATKIANAIFKHVDMITYHEKFNVGKLNHFMTINAENYLK